MNCCQCQGIEDLFDEKTATKELRKYRKQGADQTTRMLTAALKAEGVQGLSLLDIGGGVGAVQHDLLEAGADRATDVDASQAYLQAARSEAQRRNLDDKIRFRHANFVDIAAQIPPAGVVTLDRVICCYPEMEKMVSLSAARAQKLYGLVYPRDTWWAKAVVRVMNFSLRLRRSSFRSFVHPSRIVEGLIAGQGLKRRFYRRTWLWQVAVYAR